MAENPFDHNAPVGEEGVFAGRQEVFSFVQANLVGGHQRHALVILGAPQMGKSSVLRRLPAVLDPRYIPVRLALRAGTVASEKAWLTALAETLPQALSMLNMQSARIPELPAHPAELREMLIGEVFSQGLNAMRRDRHLLMLVDNAERLLTAVQNHTLPRDTFHFLAELLEKHRHFDVLMAFDSHYEPELLAAGPPFDPGLFHRLGPLSPEETSALITGRLPEGLAIEPAALDTIYDLTAGHPYLTQLVGWLLFERSAGRGHNGPITAGDALAVADSAVAMGSDTLSAVWSQGTRQEQLVLTALTALNPQEPPTPVPHEDIGAWLIAADLPLDPRTVNAAWRRLEYEGVLRLTGDGQLTIAGGLQRRWLRSHVTLPAGRISASWRRVILLVAATVALLALLLAILSANPGGGPEATTGASDATITLMFDLQATADAYNATQTATAP
ncbi:MAG: ATP-binding protein [Anaerolineae bacterium]|nr:ATP-binding protein [Anaerolineae bacterium]